jgi:hypothetical protein
MKQKGEGRENNKRKVVIPGFRPEADESCAHLRYYVASNGNYFRPFRTTYRSYLWGLTEDGTDRLSRNVGNKLTLPAA